MHNLLVLFLATFALLTLLPDKVSADVASVRAGPYQAVFFWFAYRLEVEYYGAGNTNIAPRCVPVTASGACNFDSFVKFINAPGRKMWKGETDIGNDPNPDFEHAVNELKRTNYGASTNFEKLVPGYLAESFSEALKTVMDCVRHVRTELHKAGRDEGDIDALNKLGQAMEKIMQSRREDDNDGKVRAFRQFVQKNGAPGLQFRFKTAPLEGQIQPLDLLDTDATMRVNPGRSHEVTEVISLFAAKYKEPGNTKSHDRLIADTEAYHEELSSPLPCTP